ncbi:Zinc finger, BED-type [Sesbania bispinosa]|nr:Zinc finger, BED-type [Sesbania bispinosa]
MANQGEFMASETVEHIVSTPPTVSNTGTMLPLRSVGRRNRSEAWNHFTIEHGSEKKAKCNYCGGLIKFENETSAMRSHTSRCMKNPIQDRDMRKRQKSIASSATEVGSSPVVPKCDQ